MAAQRDNLLLTTTVGSYAMPGWLLTAGQAIKRGDYGAHDIEKPEDVAERIRLLLRYVDPTRLQILPDCGFSQTARWAAFAKMQAMVAGAKIVRQELSGEAA